jgi:predicted cobalt transporter CbtA
MVGTLLLRGMLVGIVAGLVCFGFLRWAGEPHIDRAIAFEAQMDEQKAQAEAAEAQSKGMSMPAAEAEEELVSRPTQAGFGLLTAVVVYCAAFGGLFALVFAFAYGRASELGPRATAALLAASGFIAIYLVPYFKYPANPPAVGNPDTIGMRTELYFVMIVVSIVAMVIAVAVRNRLVVSQGRWNATLWGAALYLAIVCAVGALMPGINEVPETFPPSTLWSFRVASLGGQAIMWTVIGLGFGALTHRVASRNANRRLDTSVL